MRKSELLNCSKNFSEWFDGTFLCSRDAASPLIFSENPEVRARYKRIKKVCTIIIENPDEPEEWIRREIALTFFVTMRCSLDYLNYAKMVLQKFRESC